MHDGKTKPRLTSAALCGALLIGSLHAAAAEAQAAASSGTGAADAAAAPAAANTSTVAQAAAPASGAAEAPTLASNPADPPAPAAAAAPAPAGASPLTANVTLASQYVSRGFRQGWGKPAIQGGIDYAHPSGLFVGTWLSSVSSKFVEDGTVEWDLYGGYGGSIGDLSYTGTVYYYVYPGARMAASDTSYNYGEFVAALTYKWFTAKYWLTYTPNYFGYDSQSLGIGSGQGSRGSGYLDLNTNIDLTHGFSLLVHYGWERVQNFSAYNWQDAKVAVSKTFDGGWTLTGAVTKGWGATNVYDNYTTGARDSSGNIAVSNPLATTVLATLTKVF